MADRGPKCITWSPTPHTCSQDSASADHTSRGSERSRLALPWGWVHAAQRKTPDEAGGYRVVEHFSGHHKVPRWC